MLDLATVKQQWEQQGFCILPNFLSALRCQQLQPICDRILNQWLSAQSSSQSAGNWINMAFLTDPVYFQHHEAELIALLEFIADPQILEILQFVAGQSLLFHNTQYFFPPPHQSFLGSWHRDTQFMASEPQLEQQRMQSATGVHFRVALLADACLEYVPGSEKRWDTVEEYAIRKGLDGKASNSEQMSGKQTLQLQPGDALFFHAWGIHRGIYNKDIPRRTFDLIYQWGNPCDYCPPPATCFQHEHLLRQLSPQAQEFFNYFIQTYQRYW